MVFLVEDSKPYLRLVAVSNPQGTVVGSGGIVPLIGTEGAAINVIYTHRITDLTGRNPM